jgi:hypothetical protein
MLTKSEIGKLPVEQQEILAQLELGKARRREKLLEQARGKWFAVDLMKICSCVLTGGVFFFLLYQLNHKDSEGKRFGLHVVCTTLIGLSFVLSIIAVSVDRMGRRFNALLELLEFDRKNLNGFSNSNKEKIGESSAK